MTVILEGDRLRLREFTPDDWSAVHAYAVRPEAVRFQVWGPNTPEESRAFVAEAVAAAREEPRTRFTLAMVLADSDEVIGDGTLNVRSRRFRNGEIAYIVHPDHWGRGCATEAARLLLALGFGHLSLHRIYATCHPDNVASARVLHKLGMVREGRLRQDRFTRDGWRDSDLYGVLAHEWRPAGGVAQA